jgi:hypothetical protein
MSRGLLALVLMLAAVPGQAAPDAPAALDSCISRLEPELDVGFAKIAARCPDLAPSLRASPWAAWLPSDWDKPDNNLSRRGLEELRALIGRESARSGGAVQAPRLASLAPLLATLRTPSVAHGGWWARFKAWLHEVFAPRPARPESGWLRRLITRLAIPPRLLDALAVVALCLVAVLAATIVTGELRAAGWLGRRRRPTGADARPRPGVSLDHAWAEIEGADPDERPRLLLELIAARLAAQDRLPPARALTVRELLEAARLPVDADRERLRELAGVSERLRFSDRLLSPQALGAALAHGRELLAGLEAAAP